MEDYTKDNNLDHLSDQVEKIEQYFEKMKINEYVELLNKPKRMIYLNFISGLSKGLGTALGFTLLSAGALIILKDIVKLNVPLIGKFVAEIVRIVEKSNLK